MEPCATNRRCSSSTPRSSLRATWDALRPYLEAPVAGGDTGPPPCRGAVLSLGGVRGKRRQLRSAAGTRPQSWVAPAGLCLPAGIGRRARGAGWTSSSWTARLPPRARAGSGRCRRGGPRGCSRWLVSGRCHMDTWFPADSLDDLRPDPRPAAPCGCPDCPSCRCQVVLGKCCPYRADV